VGWEQLFGRELVSWLKRPDLKLDCDISNESYFHEVNHHP